MADAFQSVTDSFLAWFKSAGGMFRDDLIRIEDLRSRDAGRGVVAIADIQEDCILFTIPRIAILNTETSNLSTEAPGIFDDIDPENGAWTKLMLVMLYEYFRKDSSRWRPYFDVLPKTHDTPMFWSTEELHELKFTELSEAKIGRAKATEMIEDEVLTRVDKYRLAFFASDETPLAKNEMIELAHSIGSTIMAYAFNLATEDEADNDDEPGEDGWIEDRESEQKLGMVPMADILNANAEFNAIVNHGETHLEIISLRSIPAGNEILNYYGPLATSELLRRYGYTTLEHKRYDIISISWDSFRLNLAKQLSISTADLNKVDASTDPDDYDEDYFIERDSGNPNDHGQLTDSARLVEVAPDLSEAFEAYIKVVSKCVPRLSSIYKKRDHLFHKILLETLLSKSQGYSTSIFEDVSMLDRKGISKRHRMAIEVRLGEKYLLQEAIDIVKAKTEAGDDSEHQSVSKKAKTRH